MTPDSSGPCLDRMQLEQIASGGTLDEAQSIHLNECRACRDQVDSAMEVAKRDLAAG